MTLQALLKEKASGVARKVRQAAASVDAVVAAASADAASGKAGASGFFGGQAALEDFYIPSELVGGACPRVKGQEREVAWNAAAEACDSERIHMVWSVTEDKVWYLAARASEFAEKPFTWCPFASLLPGMKDATPAPVCYAYYSEEAATMMTVTEDTLQIHRGTTAVVRAKAERTVREFGGAALVDVDPALIVKLTPMAWQSVSLHEDRTRRMLSLVLVAAGLTCAMLAFLIWIFASLSIVTHHAKIESVQVRTQDKTMELMTAVEKLRASVLRDQIGRFADLNEGLVQISGWLKFYQVRGNVVRWRALVPASLTGERIKDIGAKLLDNSDKGLTIGTDSLPVDKK